jgi:hypothetical protein
VPATVTALVMQLVAKDPAWRPGGAEVARRAGRLRDDLRDSLSAAAGRARDLLAAAAAVPPPAPVIVPAAFAAEARRQVPAASLPGSRGRPGARRRRRRPVPVLASAAVAGLIIMVLAVTVGAALVGHPVGVLPSAPPGQPAGGTAAAPPARQPSSASPGRKARSRTSSGDAGTLQMAASVHRTATAPDSGREKIRRHRLGKDAGQGQGEGQGNSQDQGTGDGNGQGQGTSGNGQGQGTGGRNGQGQETGNENAPVLSVSSWLPGRGSGVTATGRPPNAEGGRMKAGSSAPKGSAGIVGQLVGVGGQLQFW